MAQFRFLAPRFFPSSSPRQKRSGVSVMLGAMLLLLSALPRTSHASFGIMPMEAALQAPRPGSRVTSDLEAYNGSDQTLHISASVMDWTLNRAGQYQFLEAGTLPDSCAKWIEFNPVEFNLAPKQTLRVRYSIATPSDFSGEHRAMIFFQSRPVPLKGTNNIELMVSTRVACKVFISPAGESPHKAKISDMSVDASASQNVKIAFENTGSATFRVQGRVEARGADGQVVAKGELGPPHAQVLPGAGRDLTAQWDKPLPPGPYRIKAVLDYGGKTLAGGELTTTITPAPEAEKAQEVAPAPAPSAPQKEAGK